MTMIVEANAYETERLSRIMHNQERLAALGVLQQKTLMDSAFRVVKNPTKRVLPRKIKGRTPPSRSSPRLSGGPAEFAGLSHEEGAAIERKATAAASGKCVAGDGHSHPRAQKPTQAAAPRPLSAAEAAQRCSSQARGSIYDSVAGITCHFCRQKKLCGEADCPRCANRDPGADCIGKSECRRCGGASGRFCRACLLVRYGQTLEHVRGQKGWLCPHCYEDEHPEQGWICNSSICMTRRGMKPTGIAIFDAQAQGFTSVAHLVAHRLGRPLPAALAAAVPDAATHPKSKPDSTPPPAADPSAGPEGKWPAAAGPDAAAVSTATGGSQWLAAAKGGAAGRKRKQEATPKELCPAAAGWCCCCGGRRPRHQVSAPVSPGCCEQRLPAAVTSRGQSRHVLLVNKARRLHRSCSPSQPQ